MVSAAVMVVKRWATMIVVRPLGTSKPVYDPAAAAAAAWMLDALLLARLLRPGMLLLCALLLSLGLLPVASSLRACVTTASLAASRAEVASSSSRICDTQG